MNNDEALKQKRAKILSELINKIKEAIDKNKIKGEKSSKIFILGLQIIPFIQK